MGIPLGASGKEGTPPANAGIVQAGLTLGLDDPVEAGMATHSVLLP